MRNLFAAMTLLVPPVHAQEVTFSDDTVTLENRRTYGTQLEETYVFGDVVVLHTRRPNNTHDYDSIEVVQVPDGYIAVPYSIDVLEGETGEIVIMKYLGF
jgi:uncharacterized protein affecting Mg2+/Co2+ transport